MAGPIAVPAALARKARAGGPECLEWLDALPGLVAEIERDWGICVGAGLDGGTASFVARATRSDGSDAVLKLAMPAAVDGWETLETESRVLEAAGGRACARLLAHDAERHALLTERLGPPLSDLNWPLPRRLEVICSVLRQLWAVPPVPGLPTGADKARWLHSYIGDAWARLDRPCPAGVIDHARRLADRRAAAFRADRAVLLHGDAHAWNTLRDPLDGERFRFIDPDGFFGEPEYDVSISMREYPDDLTGSDSAAAGRRRARFLAELTGTDPAAVWEWGCVERVSTGLLLIDEGKNPELGRTFLRIAEAWAGA